MKTFPYDSKSVLLTIDAQYSFFLASSPLPPSKTFKHEKTNETTRNNRRSERTNEKGFGAQYLCLPAENESQLRFISIAKTFLSR